MLLATVIVFGLVFALQLHRLSRQLETKETGGLRDLLEELKALRRDIAQELRWYQDSTFAHELREFIQETPTTIVDELSWHKNLSFAYELREWIETAASTISEDIAKVSAEVANTSEDILQRLDSMGRTLASIDNNTFRK